MTRAEEGTQRRLLLLLMDEATWGLRAGARSVHSLQHRLHQSCLVGYMHCQHCHRGWTLLPLYCCCCWLQC